MPLNYSKWNKLELSDDSDIEGHPNVDHKSLVRWRQRDIHEKREVRKHKITQLQANIDCDNVLLPRITDISSTLSKPETNQLSYFNSLVEKLEKNPSKDCPPGNDPSKPEQTYDGMLLLLLRGVTDAVKKRIQASSNLAESEKNEKLGKELAAEMAMHVTRLKESISDKKKELEEEIREQDKKITSDDIHEGFDSKYVPPAPAPAPVPISKPKKSKEVTYEVLNPGAPSPAPGPEASPEPEDGSDTEDAELPQLTPSLEAFSKLPLGAYDKSFEFIQFHRDVYVPGASDALLIAAFTAQGEGKKKYARQCVHQSLLLQYCEKLGKDGVGVFFKKMMSGDKRAEKVFVDDVEKTYAHLAERVEITQAETANSAGKEQIQLVAENPDVSINFNVPDGPPPTVIELEGPGAADLDIEEVRKALQFRWDMFCSFPKNLQEALKGGKLEEVNKVLGDMDIPVAEDVVQKLDMAGILDFSEKGIRDATGQ